MKLSGKVQLVQNFLLSDSDEILTKIVPVMEVQTQITKCFAKCTISVQIQPNSVRRWFFLKDIWAEGSETRLRSSQDIWMLISVRCSVVAPACTTLLALLRVGVYFLVLLRMLNIDFGIKMFIFDCITIMIVDIKNWRAKRQILMSGVK